MNPLRIPAFLLSTLTLWTSAQSLGAPDTRDLDARLERLVARLDTERERVHVPGLAIAVIQDDQVVLTRGLGFADVEKQVPVTADTLFAVGSTTKAFTAALIALLVDEGKLGWDAPVTDYLPWFQLSLDTHSKKAEATLRDLLSHRTGFTRMGMLWAGTNVSRDEVLHTAVKAEPWARFRKSFHYNNVMYLAAGEAAAAAAGSDWDTLMHERLLAPLGMASASTSIAEAKKSPHLAHGYVWNEDTGSYDAKTMVDLNTIAPAGAVNASAKDMAQWVRFQLGRGAIGDERLVSEENLTETWKPNVRVSPEMEYGMGWFVREYEGRRLLEHGGNIDGFAAEVAFLPDEGLGFALLTNVTATGLQQSAISIVFDALLGDPDAAPALAATDLEPYVGAYEADFAQFAGSEFEVLIRDGKLAVDVPGQTLFELLPPDEEGKWYFALTKTIAVDFERDGDGNVTLMHLFQHGLTMELPRQGTAVPADVDPEEARPFLGVYHDEALNDDLTVVVSKGRLALDVPGQMVYEMFPPDEQGKRFFRVSDQFALLFENGEDGDVSGFTFFERGTERFCPRVGDAPEGRVLPTVAEVLALRQSDLRALRWNADRTLRMTGKVRQAQAGVEGTVVTTAHGPDRFRTDLDFAPFGSARSAVSPEGGWTQNPLQGIDVLTGERLAQARIDHPGALFGDWRAAFDRIDVTGTDELDGRKTVLVTLAKGDLPPTELVLDAENGDILRSKTVNIQFGSGVRIPMETTFEDYREAGGLRMPFRIVVSNEHTGRTILQLESIETGIPVDDAIFAVPGDR